MSWTTVGSLNINWDTVSMSVSESSFQFSHVHLSAGTQTEPRADGPNEHEARRLLRTAAPDTRALVLGHKRSNCRVLYLVLEADGWISPTRIFISGIASLNT